MATKLSVNELINTNLITLFDQMIQERPDILEEIPNNSSVIMQMSGNETFNQWAQSLAADHDAENPKFFVTFTFKSALPKPKEGQSVPMDQVQAVELQAA
jgi:hypothetical protein